MANTKIALEQLDVRVKQPEPEMMDLILVNPSHRKKRYCLACKQPRTNPPRVGCPMGSHYGKEK